MVKKLTDKMCVYFFPIQTNEAFMKALQKGTPNANGAVVRPAEKSAVPHEIQTANVVRVGPQNLLRAAGLQVPDTQRLVLGAAADTAIGHLHYPARVRLVSIQNHLTSLSNRKNK